MTRPKKGEPGYRKSVARWRKTMLEKYGGKAGLHRKMQMCGSKGGQQNTSSPKGFAANPELAAKAGRIGGRVSRRTGISTGQGKTKTYIYNGD